jgi:hypothetical protein
MGVKLHTFLHWHWVQASRSSSFTQRGMQEGAFGKHWTGDEVGLRVDLHVFVGIEHVTGHSELDSQ